MRHYPALCPGEPETPPKGEWIACLNCLGNGTLRIAQGTNDHTVQVPAYECPACKGAGRLGQIHAMPETPKGSA